MVPTLPLANTPELHRLRGAFAAGDVYLVNEDAHRVTFEEALDARCWAHLTSARDGQVYVQELRSSRELLEANYQEMLGLNV